MLLINPHTGKLVDAPDGVADQLLRAGFREQEPEVVAPVETDAAPRARRSPRKPRT